MNIHGHKLRIAKIKNEIKESGKKIKYLRLRGLERRKLMHQHLIMKLRQNKKVKIRRKNV